MPHIVGQSYAARQRQDELRNRRFADPAEPE